MKLNFEKDIEINPDQIGKELLNHAKKFFQYNQKYLELAEERDKLKEVIEITHAKLDANIRQNAISKITEKAIDAEIKLDPAYIEAKENYINKQYKAEVLLAGVRSFEHRKHMLNNITQLTQSEYFAKPKNPYNLSEVANSERENLNKKRKRD